MTKMNLAKTELRLQVIKPTMSMIAGSAKKDLQNNNRTIVVSEIRYYGHHT
jgi:hypothetical protein